MELVTIVLRKADEGGYIAHVKEVPGAISEGETMEEACENVLDAMRMVHFKNLEKRRG